MLKKSPNDVLQSNINDTQKEETVKKKNEECTKKLQPLELQTLNNSTNNTNDTLSVYTILSSNSNNMKNTTSSQYYNKENDITRDLSLKKKYNTIHPSYNTTKNNNSILEHTVDTNFISKKLLPSTGPPLPSRPRGRSQSQLQTPSSLTSQQISPKNNNLYNTILKDIDNNYLRISNKTEPYNNESSKIIIHSDNSLEYEKSPSYIYYNDDAEDIINEKQISKSSNKENLNINNDDIIINKNKNEKNTLKDTIPLEYIQPNTHPLFNIHYIKKDIINNDDSNGIQNESSINIFDKLLNIRKYVLDHLEIYSFPQKKNTIIKDENSIEQSNTIKDNTLSSNITTIPKNTCINDEYINSNTLENSDITIHKEQSNEFNILSLSIKDTDVNTIQYNNNSISQVSPLTLSSPQPLSPSSSSTSTYTDILSFNNTYDKQYRSNQNREGFNSMSSTNFSPSYSELQTLNTYSNDTSVIKDISSTKQYHNIKEETTVDTTNVIKTETRINYCIPQIENTLYGIQPKHWWYTFCQYIGLCPLHVITLVSFQADTIDILYDKCKNFDNNVIIQNCDICCQLQKQSTPIQLYQYYEVYSDTKTKKISIRRRCTNCSNINNKSINEQISEIDMRSSLEADIYLDHRVDELLFPPYDISCQSK